jgi:hypothetical protein
MTHPVRREPTVVGLDMRASSHTGSAAPCITRAAGGLVTADMSISRNASCESAASVNRFTISSASAESSTEVTAWREKSDKPRRAARPTPASSQSAERIAGEAGRVAHPSNDWWNHGAGPGRERVSM